MIQKIFVKSAAFVLSAALLTGCASVAAQPESSQHTTEATEPAEMQTLFAPSSAGALLPPEYGTVTAIDLSDDGITVDGQPVSVSDEDAVYTANDIIYYEDRDAYASGNPYGEGAESDRHAGEEAARHTVVHITQPGTYVLRGTLSAGQIAVDLGKNAKTDPDAVVTLILDNLDLTCTVAPGIIFYRVYECDSAWVTDEENYTANPVQDTSAAGANIVLRDGSTNTVRGSYVARIYKDAEGEKKLHKYDGAVYSKMSMNVYGEQDGTGILNIEAENEGLDTELHLTVNGGVINIRSQNDGINTNEDNVSVTTINGGSVHIVAGLGEEGDGVDSNGYLVINGGVVISAAKPMSDSGLDSSMGSYVNGGFVLATGSTMDWAESNSTQVTMNLQFAQMQEKDEAIVVTDAAGIVVFAYDPDADENAEGINRGYQGVVLSCPNLQQGSIYHVYVGGDVSGTDVSGLYDPNSVTAFTGTRQQYTGTDVGRGGMHGARPEGDFQRPEGDFQRPEGEQFSKPGDQFGERPEGGKFPDGERPEMPEGQMPQGGFGGFPGGQPMDGEPSVDFFMNDSVNAFSGITDEQN